MERIDSFATLALGNMASLGGQHENYSNNPEVEHTSKRAESREGSAERKARPHTGPTAHAPALTSTAPAAAATNMPAEISSCSPGNTLHWFAQVGGSSNNEDDSQVSKDREEKLKYARDRQNEERQKKIEELRAQAEAAQRYREQKEEERRRRIEDMRVRDTEKRHQVEERKKAIIEAEKERREYILKKNQERESRIEVKKRDRNSIGFAFGSSTPRLLDVPADYGLVSPSAFWGQRRSTSISNVAGASLTRRSSERELADSGAKKRASSSTDRHDDHRRKSSSMYEVFNWGYSNDEPPKRFSLSIASGVINIDGPGPATSKQTAHRPHMTTTTATSTTAATSHNNNNNYNSFHNSYRKGSRSGNATPGGHFNNSRPGSAMSTSTNLSTSGLVPRRPATAPRKPRPASIAGTGMSLEEINKLKKDHKPPVKTATAASPSAQTTPKRTANLMSTSLIVTSSSSRLNSAEKKTPSKREPLVPKASSASKALSSRTASSERISRVSREPKTRDASAMSRSMIVASSSSTSTTTTTSKVASAAPDSAPAPAVQNGVAKEAEKTTAEVPVPMDAPAPAPAVSKAEKEALNSVKTEEVSRQEEEQNVLVQMQVQPDSLVGSVNVEEKVDEGTEKEELPRQPLEPQAAPKKPSRSKENSEVRELTPPAANAGGDGTDLMTASMMAKKITTEEQAKAALAERRRLAREEAERQAELERQRLEAERLAEIKAQEEEAERQRLFEEESTRLAEEQRRGEEERLRKAIEEAQQREEEEQRKREEEEKQRVEREEAEKKAKEEAEKQRIEVAERLKREEKEREERRKRVEAIMSRTRKAGAAATPSKESNDKAAPAAATETAPADGSSSSDSNSVSGSSNNSAGGSPSTAVATVEVASSEATPNSQQAMYEQSVLDKENSLINSFSTMIIDENAKNLQQQHQQVSNGKLLADFDGSSNTTNPPAVANGNGGHFENVNNKNDINLLQDAVAPVTTQLIDLSIESQDLHLNNNNSLLTSTAATTTLVTADSHENKDISLL
ncbi:ensconsin isoform X7 [Drosophila guanche]|uniref:ensconsin isoform X7 n=1 Tax=Drosophila guanche TaxID=7266 RepID=UPI001471CFEF|nr:ensconsin isoform X7 [Drosophila guanche]